MSNLSENILPFDLWWHLDELGICLTDEEQEILIRRSAMVMWKERRALLEKLAKETKDTLVRDRIDSEISMENIALAEFRTPSEGYLYALFSGWPDGTPELRDCFTTIELAEENGKYNELPFSIYKMPIQRSEEYKEWRRWKAIFYEGDGEISSVSYVWPGKMAADPQCLYEFGECENFSHSKRRSVMRSEIKLPHPYKKGDIVEDIVTGQHGIVTGDTKIGLILVRFLEKGEWAEEVSIEPWVVVSANNGSLKEDKVLQEMSYLIKEYPAASLQHLQKAMCMLEIKRK